MQMAGARGRGPGAGGWATLDNGMFSMKHELFPEECSSLPISCYLRQRFLRETHADRA